MKFLFHFQRGKDTGYLKPENNHEQVPDFLRDTPFEFPVVTARNMLSALKVVVEPFSPEQGTILLSLFLDPEGVRANGTLHLDDEVWALFLGGRTQVLLDLHGLLVLQGRHYAVFRLVREA